MTHLDQLRSHGLFEAKVPRYSSYPDASHFENGVGQVNHSDWLHAIPRSDEISVYIHIPFCKRLCWYCACRTQGTKTSRPVNAYVEYLRQEIRTVRSILPFGVRMGRLHLGGGTPTILSAETMSILLDEVFGAFPKSDGFEFSVEIDPTDAKPAVLGALIKYGLNRASIGIQDFAPTVQKAMGRTQSFAETKVSVDFLRQNGGAALNCDLLYGLPHQTPDCFEQTLDQVLSLNPDRLSVGGYAHVPWVSKRQAMIKETDLPTTEMRYALASLAKDVLAAKGYEAIGMDNYARPGDSLCQAQKNGSVRRNFQGYTDDQCVTQIGIGASAISKFRQGYVQNAIATSAYQDRIGHTRLAGYKGYVMTRKDKVIADIIEDLLCRFRLSNRVGFFDTVADQAVVRAATVTLMRRFPNAFFISHTGLQMNEWAKPLARIIANSVDAFSDSKVAYSAAI